MKYNHFALFLSILLVTFGSCSNHDSGSENLKKLTGTWKNNFTRNGEKGVRFWTIGKDFTLSIKETGNGKMLSTFYSELDSSQLYSFFSKPADLLTNLTDTSFETPGQEVVALIISESKGDTTFRWSMKAEKWKTRYWMVSSDSLLIWFGDQRELFVRVHDGDER